MAKAARPIRVASNPSRNAGRKNKGKTTMTAAKKKEFLARMAKGRKAATRNGASASKSNPAKKRRRNPTAPTASNPRKKRNSRRNPEPFLSLIGDPKTLLTQAVVGLLAAAATRQIPQMIMTTENVGWKGYLANAGTGLASTWLAGEFLGKAAAQAALIGSTVIILDRVLTEKVSPIGRYLQLTGTGDATAATSLGTIADGYFIHPRIVDKQGRPIIPHEIADAATEAGRDVFQPRQIGSQAVAMAGANRSSRFKSRFA